jgi:short-subunit dehydrogenase
MGGMDTAGQERVVVITGASGGIGAALAHVLARRGDALVLAARRHDELQTVARAAGGRTHTVVADVTRRGDVERIRDEALRVFGRIDVWVNNAGRGISKKVLDLTDDDVDAILAVNLKSALYGMQAVATHFMTRSAGHLVNVSSFLSRVPLATPRSIYSASKAALNSLTANMRMDLRRTHPGIHVSLVMPGIVATEFHANAVGGQMALPPGPPPMPAQTAQEVAAIIAELLDHPVSEVYTNPATPAIARRYYEDVGAFEDALAAPPAGTPNHL